MAPAVEPDLSTLASAAQIFSSSYTLPQIRAIHQSLHVAIDDRQARLRTQVGSSYRELLGTADNIVLMREDNDSVRTLLSRMGERCGRGAVGQKMSGMGKFVATRDEEGLGDLARLRLLEECTVLMERLLRGREVWGAEGITGKGERLQLGMKVFLLSRLIAQSFAEKDLDDEIRTVLETTKKRLLVLRQKLTRSVDRTLESAGNGARDNGDLLCAMCAFILQSSAGDRDAVQKLLQVRAKAISAAVDPDHQRDSSAPPTNNTEGILRGLGLYTRTLLEVQDLVPYKLQGALSNLKGSRLLQDTQLRGIESLRLDVLQRWCGEEVQYYTPFLRHDDLDADSAKALLLKWADQGTDLLLDGLRKTLARMTEFKAIVDLRTRVLQLWIQQGGRARGFDPSEMQESLRLALIQRLLALVDTKASKLHLVGSEISSTLGAWQPGVTDAHLPLWDHSGLGSLVSSDTDPAGSGASAVRFIKDIASRLHGRGDAVSRTVRAYDGWRGVAEEVRAVVVDLRARRWENDAEEIEDEETIQERSRTLSGEDPDRLQKRLDERLGSAFQELEGRISELWSRERNSGVAGPVAMYLLRVLRDIRANLPALDSIRSFGVELVPGMHEQLTKDVAKGPMERFTKGPLKLRAVGVQRILWEDDSVPVQPSVGVFGFIRDIEMAMSDVGLDLWSPRAVGVLKARLARETREAWGEALVDVLKVVEPSQEKQEATPADGTAEEGGQEGGGAAENATEGTEQKNDDGDGAGDDIIKPKDDPESSVNESSEATQPAPKDAGDESATSPPNPAHQPGPYQERRDLLVQWFFDTAYLQLFLGQSNDDIKALRGEILAYARLDKEVDGRISQAAALYYKRTSLLFGLLTSHDS